MTESDALETLLRVSPDAVIIADGAGRILQVNAQALALFGHPESELLGQPVEILLPQRLRDGHARHRASFAQAPCIRSMGTAQGIVGHRADGTEFHADIKLAPLELGGEARVVAVVRDVSELVEMSRQVERHARRVEATNEALDQFACTVAHDLKGPLRTISGYVDWLAEDLEVHLSDDQVELVERTRSACERMRELIDGALTYARATDPELSGAATLDLDTELRELVGELDPDGRLEVDLVAMPTLRTNAVPLRQVFSNLLVNACTHAGDSPIQVQVSCEEESEWYRFRVADDGVGIPEHAQRDVFVLFRSGGGGTGIGLSIVDRIVRAYGGHVRLESTPGDGATFEFTWPKHLDR